MTKTQDKNLKPRPPIVAIMGHIDHGKTALLDYIRKTNLVAKEEGGITQSIGAYEIKHKDKKITFIDTPGHEAFVKMRGRGAKIADLAILVVAADEGVKPQTIESIKILNEAKTPFIVAITKIDKANANIERVKQDLASNNVLLEGYGGSISYEAISAKTGEGVEKLLDLIILASELENLTFNPNGNGSGYILEARINPKRGKEVSVIVENGTLNVGDYMFTETASGKIKILEDFELNPVEALEPSAPALIVGFEELPKIGEKFICGKDSSIRKDVFYNAGKNIRHKMQDAQQKQCLVNIIVKARDAGSLEALCYAISNGKYKDEIRIIDKSTGDVSDNDVKMAISSKSTILAFKNKVKKDAQNLSRANKIKIICSNIIYDLTKSIEEFVQSIKESETTGELKVIAVFKQENKERQIIGGRVEKGEIKCSNVDIIRNGEKIGSGRILNIQKQKKDIKVAEAGNEIGLMISSNILVKPEDSLEIKWQNEL